MLIFLFSLTFSRMRLVRSTACLYQGWLLRSRPPDVRAAARKRYRQLQNARYGRGRHSHSVLVGHQQRVLSENSLGLARGTARGGERWGNAESGTVCRRPGDGAETASPARMGQRPVPGKFPIQVDIVSAKQYKPEAYTGRNRTFEESRNDTAETMELYSTALQAIKEAKNARAQAGHA